jgi:hypothetical protein
MGLLSGLEVPAFKRLNFHSSDAREYWGPMIVAARRAANEAELVTVAEGMRSCATVHIGNVNGQDMCNKLAGYGLVWKTLRKVGSSKGFQHRHHPPAEDETNFAWYAVVGKDRDVLEEFAQADQRSNHMIMGQLLGFPDCCCGFFEKVWPRYCDPVWQIAIRTPDAAEIEWPRATDRPVTVARVSGHPATNCMLRYMSVRISFHLPCSFQCEKTIALSEKWMGVLESMDPKVAQATRYLLSLPLAWDVNHGYAKIVTPVFTLHSGSVETTHRYVLHFCPEPSMLPDGDIPGLVGGTFWPLGPKTGTPRGAPLIIEEAFDARPIPTDEGSE